jgi:hypothetical protein
VTFFTIWSTKVAAFFYKIYMGIPPTPAPTIRNQNFHILRVGNLRRNMAFQELVSFEDVALEFTWEEW